jgi:tetratricopeptide (TPR) repeat protein
MTDMVGGPEVRPVSPSESGDEEKKKESLRFRPVERPPDPNIPFQAPDVPPHFVTRSELLEIKETLLGGAGTRLAPLTIHGPAGVGKTALAAALTHDADILEAYPDGVLWASLGPDVDVQHAQAAWGRALGVDLSTIPDTSGRAAALRNLLHTKRCLLVIDSAETVQQVKALNVGSPPCARLITTRRAERVTYMLKSRRYPLDKMSEDEALDLLTTWAGILPETYLPTVREIARRLSYLPLSLAVVGAQARMGIAWLRLLEILHEEQGPISALDADDQKVRDPALGLVLNLALSRLGDAQMRRTGLLGALAAGAGAPFDADAVGACWQVTPEEAARALDSLVEAVLVQRVRNGYALHSSIHSHLRSAASQADLETAERRLGEHYLALLERPDSDEAINAQIVQIMAAYQATDRHDPQPATLFADGLMTYFERNGLWSNLIVLATQIVEAAHRDDDLLREHTYLADLGYAHTVLGQWESARLYFERGLEVSQRLGDPASEATALSNIGATYERQGEYQQALDFYQRSLAIRERLGVKADMADSLNNVAGVYYWLEQYEQALSAFQRVLAMQEDLGDRRLQAQTLLNIGATYESQGDDDAALNAYQRSLAIYTNLGDRAGQAQTLNNLGIVHYNQGDVTRALDHYQHSLTIKEELGDRAGQASTLNNIGYVHEQTGDFRLALEYYRRSLRLLEDMEDPRADIVRDNIETLHKRME